AVEPSDGELGRLSPIVGGGFTERGDRERQQEQQAAVAQREALRQWLDETPAPPARDMEAVHEHGEALVELAPPGLGLIHPEVDARIDIEQEAAQPCLPVHPVVALEGVAQREFPQGRSISPAGRSRPAVTVTFNRSRGSKLWRDGQKMNANTSVDADPCAGAASLHEASPHER